MVDLSNLPTPSTDPEKPDVYGAKLIGAFVALNTGKAETSSVLAKADKTYVDTELDSKADLIGGKVATSQLPSVSLSGEHVPVANQAARLALTSLQVQGGDIATQADNGTDYMLVQNGNPAFNGDWLPLGGTSSGVQSVNGVSTAVVVLGKADIGLGNVANMAPADLPVSTAQTQAISDAVATRAPATNIAKTALATAVQTSLNKADSALQAVAADSVATAQLAPSVRTSLGKADTALQIIAADSVDSTKLAPSVRTSLGKADGAAPKSIAFAPGTAYVAKQLVDNAGSLYTAKVNFTSGSSFDVADWNVSTVAATVANGTVDSTKLASTLTARLPLVPTSGLSGRRTVFAYDAAGAPIGIDFSDLANPGEINVLEYGCDNTGVAGTNNATKAAANDAGFAAARTAALAQKKGIFIPPGIYDTSTTVNMFGVTVRGTNLVTTTIQQNTTGTACTTVIIVGGEYLSASNFTVRHYGSPDPALADDLGSGVHIREAFGFSLDRVYAWNCGWGFYGVRKTPNDTSGRNFMFSCSITNIRAGFCNKGPGKFAPNAAFNTGNVFYNLYFSNGGSVSNDNLTAWLGTTPGTLAQVGGWYFGNLAEVSISVINTEWFQGPASIVLDGCKHVNISQHHIEGWMPTGSASLYDVRANSQTEELNLSFEIERWLVDTSKCSGVALITMKRPTVVRWGSRPIVAPETVNGLPPMREHAFLSDGGGTSNGSQVLKAGNPTGSFTTFPNADSFASGVTTQVVDLFSLTAAAALPHLAAPAGLTASTSAGSTTLGWSAVTGAASYEVQRRTHPNGAWTLIGRSDTTSYVDAGVGSNPDYDYQITASSVPIGDASTPIRSSGLPGDGSDVWTPTYGTTGALATVAPSDFTVINPTYTTTGSEAEPPGAYVQASNVLRVASGATSGSASGADNLFIRPIKTGWTSWKNWRWEAELASESSRPAQLTVALANVLTPSASYARFKILSSSVEFAYKTPSGTTVILSNPSTIPGITSTYKRAIVELIFNVDGTATMRYTLAGVAFEATIPSTDAALLPAGAVQLTVSDQGSTATPYAMSMRSYPTGADGLFKLSHGAS